MPKKKRPDKLLRFKCVDKENFEHWSDDRAILNFPRPFRCVLSGPPNVGKSSVIKSLICTADPLFQRGFLYHPDPLSCDTGEYAGVGLEPIDELPPTDFWYSENKAKDHWLLVIDDIDTSDLSREQRTRFDRLTSNVSTHCMVSILCSAQLFYNLPVFLRKTSNLFVFYRPVAEEQDCRSMSKRCGLSADTLMQLFKDHCPDRYSSIWIDLTDNSPAKIRIDGVKVLREIE